MPINSSRANASARAYGFTANRRRPSPLVSYNPSAAAVFSIAAHPLGFGYPSYEVVTITGSGTLQLDPLIPVSGPTAFQLEFVTVGGGGGSGSPGFTVSSPPFFYPRLAASGGAGGGGGVTPFAIPWVANTRTVNVAVGAGGAQNTTGSPTQFGPPTLLSGPLANQNSSSGGGYGGPVPGALGGGPGAVNGFWDGGSGGGNAGGYNRRYTVSRPFPFGGPYINYDMTPTFSTLGGGTPPQGAGAGSDGIQQLMAYYTPTNGVPWAWFSGPGGGAAPNATTGAGKTAGPVGPGLPAIPTQKEGAGYTIPWATGPVGSFGGGGAGGYGNYNGTPIDPYWAPPINTLQKVKDNGGGGTLYAPSAPINGIANSGGGAGSPRQYFDYIPNAQPAQNYPFYGNGASGSSGAVLVRYPVPSAR